MAGEGIASHANTDNEHTAIISLKGLKWRCLQKWPPICGVCWVGRERSAVFYFEVAVRRACSGSEVLPGMAEREEGTLLHPSPGEDREGRRGWEQAGHSRQ